MTEILNLAMPFFGLIALGVIATRFWHVKEDGLAWLNIFLIYFALPALIYLVTAAAPFEQLFNWPFVSATTGVTAAVFLSVVLVSRLAFGTAPKVAALQGTSASYGNVGYMGLPLAVAFFGPSAAVPAALVFCFDCTIQFVLTASLATLGHAANEEVHPLEIAMRVLRQVFSHPFIIATILGAAASGFHVQLPGAVSTILDMLMRSAGPCALFALGVTVGMRKFAGFGKELPLVAGMKVIVQPVLAYLVVRMVPGIEPTWLHVAVMMAALPTASNAFILASQYKAYVEGSSTAVIVTTVASAITIPLLIYAIKASVLP
ncbi:AEC family transporter [Aestuariivirga sp.]|uniref:AEC family transporter n=1 Tax=Aestuariivirga sp. TaxID=2650926 RepID=UPI0039E53148